MCCSPIEIKKCFVCAAVFPVNHAAARGRIAKHKKKCFFYKKSSHQQHRTINKHQQRRAGQLMFTQKSSSKAPPETHLTADISVRYHLTIAGSTHVRHRLYDPDQFIDSEISRFGDYTGIQSSRLDGIGNNVAVVAIKCQLIRGRD